MRPLHAARARASPVVGCVLSARLFARALLLASEAAQHTGQTDRIAMALADREQEILRLQADLARANMALADHEEQVCRLQADSVALRSRASEAAAKSMGGRRERELARLADLVEGLQAENRALTNRLLGEDAAHEPRHIRRAWDELR